MTDAREHAAKVRAKREGTGDQSQAGDYAASKRIARAHEKEQREAIESQMRSQGIDRATGQPKEKASSSRSVGNGAGRAAPPKPAFVPSIVHRGVTSGAGGSVAGVMLGALAFFTGRAYLQGGFPAVKAFYAAKFLNRTSANPNPVPTSTSATAGVAATTGITATPGPSAPASSSGSAKGAGNAPPTTVGTHLRGML